MRAFAYPNVDFIGNDCYPFIGCGRYRVAMQDPEAGETPARPNMEHLAELLDAVDALLSARPTSQAGINEERIYERRDEPGQDYQGDSQAHAYFLASIQRVLRVRQAFHALEGDIWCTGVIRLGIHRTPVLTQVEQSGFDSKLQAFLSTVNHDRVFLVPAVHLTAENTHLCRHPPETTFESAQTLTLSEWRERLYKDDAERFSRKVVVGIHAHELPLLVEILFHSPPDPEIAQWFQALTDLRVQAQITDERYWEVLEHVVGSRLPRSIPHEELMDALATSRERLYLKSTTTAEQLSKIPLREVRTTRVHQVLVALRYALPVIQTVLGLRFVLIPPGTVDDIDNPTPYYLAETPVNEADWARLLGDSPDAATHAECAAVDISLPDIRRFIARANAQAGEATRFVIPTSHRWRFAVLAGGVPPVPPRGALERPSLRTTRPSALGLSDILGVVAQLCHKKGEQYEWHGGSYRTPATDFSPVPSPEPVRAGAFARNLERGFRPALDVLEIARIP
jgi:hypothetical protein